MDEPVGTQRYVDLRLWSIARAWPFGGQPFAIPLDPGERIVSVVEQASGISVWIAADPAHTQSQ